MAPSTLALRVTVGPDAGASVAMTVDLATQLVVGTSTTSALRLTDRLVSRRHLVVAHGERGVSVRDLDTTNGTFVRGVRIAEAYLERGEPIVVGDTTILVDWTVAPGAVLPEEAEGFGRVIGRGPAMRRLFALAGRLARAELSVLIEGETGTGKELLAEELHARGPRADRPLVVFDAVDDDPHHATLALFGAAPGVFPAIAEGRAGLLELASGGTLLLDEPAELAPDLQRRLARALSRREVRRAGSEAPIPIDLRVLATSSVDLERRVERGELREDLFYVLAGARIELPPLRQRGFDDIAMLARHFWTTAGASGEPPVALLERLGAQAWPGNVRELENAVARHLATGELEEAARGRARAMPAGGHDDAMARVLAQRLPLAQARQEIIAVFEGLYVEQILREHGGNVTHAARASGLAHRYFQALKARRTR